MNKLLIVDDEPMIREAVKEYAEFDKFEVKTATNGLEAIEAVKEEDFDIILMDIMMPKMDGYAAVKEIKKIKNIPIIMLSARSEEYDKLFGFELGIDDYVDKPFSPRVLMARVAAVLRRYKQKEVARDNFKYKGLEVDFQARNIYIDGVKAKVTPKEYELLKYLVEHRAVAISREQLLKDVWGYEYYGEDRTVDTHIKMLRGNLKEYRDLIVTMRGLGYKFEIED